MRLNTLFGYKIGPWPFWHIPSLGEWTLQPEPNVEPRARHVLSWSISQGSLQGSVTLEAAWTANSTPCLSSPGHTVLFSPAPTKSGSSCLQHNSILIACSHRQTLPRLCVPILSCVLPESAELCAPFAVSSLLNQSHLFKVNALGNESWQCANGNREFQARTGKDICIKQAGNQFLVKLCRNPRFLTAHGEGRLLMQGQPLVGLGSHGSLDCSDSTLFSSIRLSSLPVSH